jgi:hypothetical protein
MRCTYLLTHVDEGLMSVQGRSAYLSLDFSVMIDLTLQVHNFVTSLLASLHYLRDYIVI